MSCRKLLPFVTRQFSTTTRRQAEIVQGYEKLKANQELFQKDDGVLVHVKKGGLDSILYKITMALGTFGVLASVYSIYRLAVGKKF